jgi:prepilin-type N-terminal cleavage/methylation domain-containing protein
MYKLRDNEGFTLLEILIAIFILTVGLGGLDTAGQLQQTQPPQKPKVLLQVSLHTRESPLWTSTTLPRA